MVVGLGMVVVKAHGLSKRESPGNVIAVHATSNDKTMETSTSVPLFKHTRKSMVREMDHKNSFLNIKWKLYCSLRFESIFWTLKFKRVQNIIQILFNELWLTTRPHSRDYYWLVSKRLLRIFCSVKEDYRSVGKYWSVRKRRSVRKCKSETNQRSDKTIRSVEKLGIVKTFFFPKN